MTPSGVQLDGALGPVAGQVKGTDRESQEHGRAWEREMERAQMAAWLAHGPLRQGGAMELPPAREIPFPHHALSAPVTALPRVFDRPAIDSPRVNEERPLRTIEPGASPMLPAASPLQAATPTMLPVTSPILPVDEEPIARAQFTETPHRDLMPPRARSEQVEFFRPAASGEHERADPSSKDFEPSPLAHDALQQLAAHLARFGEVLATEVGASVTPQVIADGVAASIAPAASTAPAQATGTATATIAAATAADTVATTVAASSTATFAGTAAPTLFPISLPVPRPAPVSDMQDLPIVQARVDLHVAEGPMPQAGPAPRHVPQTGAAGLVEALQPPVPSATRFGVQTAAMHRTESMPAAPARTAQSAPARQPPAPAPSIRLHADWTADGVRLWLGLDASVLGQMQAISDQVRQWMKTQGVRLLSLSCNGRLIEGAADGSSEQEDIGPLAAATNKSEDRKPWPSVP